MLVWQTLTGRLSLQHNVVQIDSVIISRRCNSDNPHRTFSAYNNHFVKETKLSTVRIQYVLNFLMEKAQLLKFRGTDRIYITGNINLLSCRRESNSEWTKERSIHTGRSLIPNIRSVAFSSLNISLNWRSFWTKHIKKKDSAERSSDHLLKHKKKDKRTRGQRRPEDRGKG